jgi:hypothetical protein
MMKKIAVILVLFLNSCQQKTEGFRIDKTIQKEVEERTKSTEFSSSTNETFLYETSADIEFFEDGEVEYDSKGEIKTMFRSYYYEQEGVISIVGAYGMFDGFGFSIKIQDNKATVYALVSSGDLPNYSLTEDGKREAKLEVPCTNAKLILSKYPEVKNNDPIYGYVEFESQDFYSGLEYQNQTQQRLNMKVYFKAILFGV